MKPSTFIVGLVAFGVSLAASSCPSNQIEDGDVSVLMVVKALPSRAAAEDVVATKKNTFTAANVVELGDEDTSDSIIEDDLKRLGEQANRSASKKAGDGDIKDLDKVDKLGNLANSLNQKDVGEGDLLQAIRVQAEAYLDSARSKFGDGPLAMLGMGLMLLLTAFILVHLCGIINVFSMEESFLADEKQRPLPMTASLTERLSYCLSCSSSVCMVGVVPFMPVLTPLMYKASVTLLALVSAVHHTVEESIPQEKWAYSKAYEMAFRADAAAICAACAAFFACLSPRLGLAPHLMLIVTAAVAGFCSRTFKMLMVLVTSIAVSIAQPDFNGIIAAAANQAFAGLVVGVAMHAGRWYGALHLWTWHMLCAMWFWFAARAMTSSEGPVLFS